MPPLTDAQLYRALVARDPRFDGVFFVGVTSTRIYCRPVCRAPKPRPERCRYFVTAAAAERRGFRPCLRCRPELAPGLPAGPDAAPSSTDAVAQLAREAAARIAAGALDAGGVDDLALSLGVTSRHVRRAVERELGATPAELAQTRRLLIAKQLLTETDLPVTRVAFASGFGSVRRFNTLFLERYRLAPSKVRRTARAAAGGKLGDAAPGTDAETVTLSLAFRPPYDWPAMLAYLGGRATPGVEAIGSEGGGSYRRVIRFGGYAGVVSVSAAGGHALRAELSVSLLPVLGDLMTRLRRLLDLDAEPAVIAAHLAADPRLAPLVAHHPGLRVPGALDGFELALRAVLGQQVSVRGATTLAGRLAERFGEPLPPALGDARRGLTRCAVTADRLADASAASIAAIGLPRSRAESIRALALATASGALPELTARTPVRDPAAFARRFAALPGIGPWTTAYVTMRALGWPDAFPDGDLGLRKAAGGISAARLRAEAERWRPWRSYAAHHLWESLR